MGAEWKHSAPFVLDKINPAKYFADMTTVVTARTNTANT
jgi:hypothetical protein